MKLTETAIIAAPPDEVFGYIDDLSTYPQWLRLVNSARPTSTDDPSGGDDPDRAWDVELRAKIGPFARSKQLRMVRTLMERPDTVLFERRETDGRDHAMWALRADLRPADDGATELTMHLAYDGDLWAGGGVVGAVLNDEIRRGRRRLAELIESS